MSKRRSGKEAKMKPTNSGNWGLRKVVTKGFCGGVVILGFRSELKKDYGRLSKGP